MKLLKKQSGLMKTLINYGVALLALALFLGSAGIQAQEDNISKPFIRVYNQDAKKIGKGRIAFINDSILGLKKMHSLKQIAIAEISYVKTKRSAGHNLLIGAASGAVILGTLGATTADSDALIFGYSAEEGFAGGAILGGVGGAALGGLSILLKDSKVYVIDGNPLRLKQLTNEIY